MGMKRIYAIETWCVYCKRCEVACKTFHSASKDAVRALAVEYPVPQSRVRVEGDRGHMALDEIAANMRLEKRLCHDAPFYVLGPLVTDIAPGYDHITAAIGGAVAAASGADFLCYVTPRFPMHARFRHRPAQTQRPHQHQHRHDGQNRADAFPLEFAHARTGVPRPQQAGRLQGQRRRKPARDEPQPPRSSRIALHQPRE